MPSRAARRSGVDVQQVTEASTIADDSELAIVAFNELVGVLATERQQPEARAKGSSQVLPSLTLRVTMESRCYAIRLAMRAGLSAATADKSAR